MLPCISLKADNFLSLNLIHVMDKRKMYMIL